MKSNIINFIILLSSLLLTSHSQTPLQQCWVTQTVALYDCFSYCIRKYNGKKDFYKFETKSCEDKVTCGTGTYRDLKKNVCADENTYYTYQFYGMTLKDHYDVYVFFLLRVMNGFRLPNGEYKCNDGYKSSKKMQRLGSYAYVVYICDQQLKQGQIYPKTIGQYFFEKLSQQDQVKAMNIAYGQDTFLTVFPIYKIIYIIISIFYFFVCVYECCTKAGRKIKSLCMKFCCCCGSKEEKQYDINSTNMNYHYKLTQIEKQEVQNFLKKRQQQNIKRNKHQFSYYQFYQTIKKKKQQIRKNQNQKRQIRKNSKKILKNKQDKKNNKQQKQQQNLLKTQSNIKKVEKILQKQNKQIKQTKNNHKQKQNQKSIQKKSISPLKTKQINNSINNNKQKSFQKIQQENKIIQTKKQQNLINRRNSKSKSKLKLSIQSRMLKQSNQIKNQNKS